MNRSVRQLRQSFRCAIAGLRACIRTERNFRIHLTAVFYVSLFSALGGMSSVRYAILCLCFALMLAAELFNTAIENLCDRQSTCYDGFVRETKDIAAAAVFLCAVFCVIIGILFFVPSGALLCAVRVLAARPWAMALTGLTLPLAIWFVFGTRRPK